MQIAGENHSSKVQLVLANLARGVGHHEPKIAEGGYKPDSVPSRRRSFILAVRYRTAPATYPEVVPAEAGDGDGRPSTPLFGLAPHGVYRALSVTGEAVRSYRTLSPLPTDVRWAVCSLRHFPSRYHGRALPGMLPVRSPDFPRRSEDRRERPPPPALERIAPTDEPGPHSGDQSRANEV